MADLKLKLVDFHLDLKTFINQNRPALILCQATAKEFYILPKNILRTRDQNCPQCRSVETSTCVWCKNDLEGGGNCQKCLEKVASDLRPEKPSQGVERKDSFKERRDKEEADGLEKLTCIQCGKQQCPEEYNRNHGSDGKSCNTCKEKRRKKESSETAKNTKREYMDQRPEKKIEYSMRHKIKKNSTDPNYRKKNADDQKRRRTEKPDEARALVVKRRNDMYIRLDIYIRSAEEKGFVYLLSDDQFFSMVKTECFYCGEFGRNTINGIDRMDDDRGYFKENCVPCCKDCNESKGSLHIKEFVAQCARICMHRFHMMNVSPLSELWTYRSRNGCTFSDYKHRAKKKGLSFTLTKELFEDITGRVCQDCGLVPPGGTVGIDRIDNTLGYTSENSRPCCYSCNAIKKCLSEDKYVKMCQKIAAKFMSKDMTVFLSALLPPLYPERERHGKKKEQQRKRCRVPLPVKANIRLAVRMKYPEFPMLHGRVKAGKASVEEFKKYRLIEEEVLLSIKLEADRLSEEKFYK